MLDCRTRVVSATFAKFVWVRWGGDESTASGGPTGVDLSGLSRCFCWARVCGPGSEDSRLKLRQPVLRLCRTMTEVEHSTSLPLSLTFDVSGTIPQVIMATNRADTLDPALLRPGRLDRKIEFPVPDRRQKRMVFTACTAKMNLSEVSTLCDGCVSARRSKLLAVLGSILY